MAATTLAPSPTTLDVPNPIYWDGAPEAAGQSRDWISAFLIQAGLVRMLDDAALVVSELVTNAGRWSQSREHRLSIRGSALVRARFVTISVQDWGPLSRCVQRRLKGRTRDGGLGLKLVRGYSYGYERRIVVNFENPTHVAQIVTATLRIPPVDEDPRPG